MSTELAKIVDVSGSLITILRHGTAKKECKEGSINISLIGKDGVLSQLDYNGASVLYAALERFLRNEN